MSDNKGELEKLKEMDFTEKRQYIWEYYKLHIFGILIFGFLLFQLLNIWIFNPPQRDYIYFAWMGHFVAQHTLDTFAEELDVIVENKNRYAVRATNFNLEGIDPQLVTIMQTRFFAQMQARMMDVFMLTKVELHDLSEERLVMPIKQFFEMAGSINPVLKEAMMERLVELTYYPEGHDEPVTDYMAIDLSGVAFFEQFGIQTDDLFFAAVINAQRFERVARALEVIFDV